MSTTIIDPAERIRRAQERALRAARAVTFTLTAALVGCATTVTGSVADVPASEAPTDAPTADVAEVSAPVDAGAPDAGEAVDADVTADAGVSCSGAEDSGLSWAECCERIGWDWNRGCAAWGPFMPPSMEG